MLRFLTASSRTRAIKTIRRASSFFILSSLFVLGLNALSIFDKWSKNTQPLGSAAESIASFAGYLLASLVRNDWIFILFLLNGVILRRYHSRVAAVLFILAGLWGAGLGVLIIWSVIQDPVHAAMSLLPTAGFLAIFFTAYFLIAGRSLAAAMALSGHLKDDPISVPIALTERPTTIGGP